MKKALFISMVAFIVFSTLGIVSAEEPQIPTLTLDEAIAYAEGHSLQMMAAAEDLKTAQAKVKEASSVFWPTFEASLAGTNISDSSSAAPSLLDQAIINELISLDPTFANTLNGLSNTSAPDWINSTNASLTQMIFSAPAFQQYKIMKKNYAYSLVNYAQTKEDLAYNITNIFIAVSKAKEGIRIYQEALSLAEKNLKMTKAFFEAGIIVKTDVLKMELAVSNTRQALLAAENGYQTALSLLKQILGYPQDKAVDIVVPESLPAPVFPEGVHAPYSQRYDWQLAQIQREMAEIGVKLSKAGYLPLAVISYTYEDTEYDKFAPGGGDTALTIGLKWSFSFGGKVNAQVKQAEASLNKAQIYCESVDQTAAMEVLQARLGYTEAQKRMEIATLSLKIAQENSNLAVKRYEAGVGTTLEVADAQVALEQSKYNELTARYDLYLSGLKLEKALGVYRRTPNEGSGKQ